MEEIFDIPSVAVDTIRMARFQTTELDVACALIKCSSALFLPQYRMAYQAKRLWMTDIEGMAKVNSPLANLSLDSNRILYHRERAFKNFDAANTDFENITSWLREVGPDVFDQLAIRLRGKHC